MELTLPLVGRVEQRGKGILSSFALHLLSDQAGSFMERNLPLFFKKRRLFSIKTAWEQFSEV